MNKALVSFGNDPDIILKSIFNSKCAHLYGWEGWDLTDRAVVQFYTTWNKGVKLLMQLRYQTHTRCLRYFIQRPHVKDQVFKRFYGLYCTMKTSNNKRLAHLAIKMANDGQIIIGKNLKCIRDGYKINLLQLRAGVSACKLRRNVNKNDERTVAMVNELRDTLRGDMFISDFNKEETEDMVFNLCVE